MTWSFVPRFLKLMIQLSSQVRWISLLFFVSVPVFAFICINSCSYFLCTSPFIHVNAWIVRSQYHVSWKITWVSHLHVIPSPWQFQSLWIFFSIINLCSAAAELMFSRWVQSFELHDISVHHFCFGFCCVWLCLDPYDLPGSSDHVQVVYYFFVWCFELLWCLFFPSWIWMGDYQSSPAFLWSYVLWL